MKNTRSYSQTAALGLGDASRHQYHRATVGCHATEPTTRAIHLIGPSLQNLDREHRYANIAPTNQLDYWQASGLLRMPSRPTREGICAARAATGVSSKALPPTI